jgi:hypothetical protein
MAASAIERYTQVSVGRVTDLAVLGYAADDVGALMAALLDNATRYSPGTVTVSGHLLEDGGVMFRVEDTGIGFGADQVAALNAAFAGPIPDVDERTGHHTGFPVVHRIARKHSIAVLLASRPLPSSGTVAMVTLPPHLLSEIPAEDTPPPPESASRSKAQPSAQSAGRPSPVADMPRRQRHRPAAEPQLSAAPGPRAPVTQVSDLQVSGPLISDPQTADPLISDPQTAEQQTAEQQTAEQQTAEQQTAEQQTAEQQTAEQQAPELPRREPGSLRGGEPRPAEAAAVPLTQRQQEAARRAFADDLSAFAAGSTGPQGTVDGTTRGGTQPEEGGQS